MSPGDPIKIVCFGDSITGCRPREAYLDKYVKWSDLIQLMAEARLGAGRVTVLNRGFAGDQTLGALARLQADVLAELPAITIVLLGGNDWPEQRAATRTNLTAIVAQLKATGSQVLLLQYAVIPNPAAPEKTWFRLAQKNDLITAVAAEQAVPVVALQPAFDAAATTQSQSELVNAVDGVHLAPGGELVVARAVFAKLVELKWL